MTGWAPKRFWTAARVARDEGGYAVLLDDRPIRTPSRSPLVLPSALLAEAVAAEWQAQEDLVRPSTMPMTRLANSAIDRVAPEFDAVATIVSAYAETDLLCYRADAPDELAERQARAWGPVLDWAAETYGARLAVTEGVVPVAQERAALDRLAVAVRRTTIWELTALHELTSLTGSLVLGLAVAEGARAPEEAWELSRLDEEWQISQWGRDAEADARTERRLEEFMDAVRFLRLARGTA